MQEKELNSVITLVVICCVIQENILRNNAYLLIDSLSHQISRDHYGGQQQWASSYFVANVQTCMCLVHRNTHKSFFLGTRLPLTYHIWLFLQHGKQDKDQSFIWHNAAPHPSKKFRINPCLQIDVLHLSS